MAENIIFTKYISDKSLTIFVRYAESVPIFFMFKNTIAGYKIVKAKFNIAHLLTRTTVLFSIDRSGDEISEVPEANHATLDILERDDLEEWIIREFAHFLRFL